MRRQRLQFVGALVGFTLLWLCVRFPYEMLHAAEKVFGSSRQIDPLTLHLHGEFVESNLGTAVEPDGSVTVRLIAEQFLFVPHCVTVPVGRPVHFRITSADVVHRFAILGTDHPMEVVPGDVNESTTQFATPGEYKAPCHEFCGAGHYDMRSRVIAVREDQFPSLQPQERLACASP
jgi:cytochrome c oxidase subunit 2